MAATNSKLNLDQSVFDDAGTDGGRPKSNASPFAGYLVSVAMTAVATFVAFGLDSGIKIPNLSIVYVIPVIVAGVSFGLGPSLCAAVLGAVAYNFFFTEPRFTLMVDDPANVWAIALLFIVGLTVSTIAFTSRRRASDIAILTREVNVLHAFSRDIATASDTRAIVSVGSQALADLFRVPAVALTIRNGDVVSVTPAEGTKLREAEISAAKSALAMGGVTRAATYPAEASRFDFWPVSNNPDLAVVIGVAFDHNDRPATQDQLIDIVKNGLALALDRASPSA